MSKRESSIVDPEGRVDLGLDKVADVTLRQGQGLGQGLSQDTLKQGVAGTLLLKRMSRDQDGEGSRLRGWVTRLSWNGDLNRDESVWIGDDNGLLTAGGHGTWGWGWGSTRGQGRSHYSLVSHHTARGQRSTPAPSFMCSSWFDGFGGLQFGRPQSFQILQNTFIHRFVHKRVPDTSNDIVDDRMVQVGCSSHDQKTFMGSIATF